MSDFEFFFSFYGLLLSLSVVEIATKLADWVGQRHRHRLSALTGLLAIFLLMELSAFWMLAWGNREVIRVGWGLVFGGLAVAVVYFLAAALVFPRNAEDWSTLDEHYWANKRLVVAGVGVANALVLVATFSWHPPRLTDYDFFAFQAAYWIPLIALGFSRVRRIDLGLLCFLIGYYVVVALRIVEPPAGGWSASMGL